MVLEIEQKGHRESKGRKYHKRVMEVPTHIPSVQAGGVTIENADVATRYAIWPSPTVIISDGPYGLGLFPGDLPTSEHLADWYRPHIKAWTDKALPETTLWFWCNEIGWATVHPILVAEGWQYKALHVWDKGIAHIAGNVNSKTIKRFPIVTEVCVQYVLDVKLPILDGQRVHLRDWLRYEWARTGLPFSKTNDACDVKNAATRKYFTKDHLWYFPPPDVMAKLANYANIHGLSTERPYFSLDGSTQLSAEQWSHMRAKWNHTHGVTNVWSEHAVRGETRLKHNNGFIHSNQKPLSLIERIITASSDVDDVVWEPFGGLCPGAIVSMRTGRKCFSAEIIAEFYELAKARLLYETAPKLEQRTF